MKRFLTPLILFIGVFLTAQLLLQNTFFLQEQDGLFLWSKDYFTLMFRNPLPLSGIIGDFLTQFYRFRFIAALVSAVEVVLAFLLFRGILSRFRLGWDVLSALLACAAWVMMALAPSAKTGVFILLVLFLLFLASRLLPKKETHALKTWIELTGTVLLLAGSFVFLFLNPKVGSRENTAAIRVGVIYSDWDKVLSVATPEAALEDRDMLPFAMMALGMKGQIGDRIFDYFIPSEDYFDMKEDADPYVHLFFRGFLYNHLLCPNEAAHNFFQLATVTEHGQSFMVLRQLVTDCFVMGDFALVRKYLAVLSRSSCHSRFIRYYEESMKKVQPREADSIDFRRSVPLVSHDPLNNLLLLDANGLRTRFLLDRVLCTLLIRGEMDRFRAVFESVKDEYYPEVPRYYRLALK